LLSTYSTTSKIKGKSVNKSVNSPIKSKIATDVNADGYLPYLVAGTGFEPATSGLWA